MKTAFTIIETIVVVAVVAVLVALVAPSLVGARGAARESKDLSNLRSHAAIVAMYIGDASDHFPSLTSPVPVPSTIRCDAAGLSVEALYFDAARLWNIGMADGYYDGKWDNPSFFSPHYPQSLRASYQLTCSALASPEFYNNERRIDPPDQLRSVRMSEVLFPAAKGLFVRNTFEAGIYRLPHQRHDVRFLAAMMDGSASSVSGRRILQQFSYGDGPDFRFGTHYPTEDPFTHTYDGVRGRDVAPP